MRREPKVAGFRKFVETVKKTLRIQLQYFRYCYASGFSGTDVIFVTLNETRCILQNFWSPLMIVIQIYVSHPIPTQNEQFLSYSIFLEKVTNVV